MTQQSEVERLRTALAALAENMRDLYRYHTHNSTIGAEVWADLECERHLSDADAALSATTEAT